MAKLTRKQKELENIRPQASATYELVEALELVKKMHFEKFDSSVDMAIRLGINVKDPMQAIRQSVLLPHGTGKTPSILVICPPDYEQEAREAGADYVGGDDYLAKIEQGWAAVDTIVTIPSMMSQIGQLGRVLGPKGLMPSPKAGTVTTSIDKTVREIKAGKIAIRSDKQGIVHSSVGRVSFPVAHLQENIETLLGAVVRAKPSNVKGTYLQGVTLSTTMGPGVNLEPQVFRN